MKNKKVSLYLTALFLILVCAFLTYISTFVGIIAFIILICGFVSMIKNKDDEVKIKIRYLESPIPEPQVYNLKDIVNIDGNLNDLETCYLWILANTYGVPYNLDIDINGKRYYLWARTPQNKTVVYSRNGKKIHYTKYTKYQSNQTIKPVDMQKVKINKKLTEDDIGEFLSYATSGNKKDSNNVGWYIQNNYNSYGLDLLTKVDNGRSYDELLNDIAYILKAKEK